MTADFKTIFGESPQKPKREPKRKAYLYIMSGGEKGKTYPLKKEETIIGRNIDSDLQIDDALISRNHASLILTKTAKVKILDLNSTNGTFVNFNKVSESYLNDEDIIHLGETIIKFLFKDPKEAELNIELYKEASLDGLTQTYNKTHFKELLTKEISFSKRHETPLSLAMLDIDHFKKINDTYGHQAGDYILATLASITLKNLRKEDIVARYGGEEFCIILKKTDIDKGYKICEKIRKLIEKKEFTYDKSIIPVTISMGISQLDEQISTNNDFIKSVDAKLYESKENGRNQTTK